MLLLLLLLLQSNNYNNVSIIIFIAAARKHIMGRDVSILYYYNIIPKHFRHGRSESETVERWIDMDEKGLRLDGPYVYMRKKKEKKIWWNPAKDRQQKVRIATAGGHVAFLKFFLSFLLLLKPRQIDNACIVRAHNGVAFVAVVVVSFIIIMYLQ